MDELKDNWYTTNPEGVFIKAIKDKYNYSIRSITLAEQTGVAAVVKFVTDKHKETIPFPFISAGSADAIAYQLEVGKENHSCPVSDATIAQWLRAIAKQLNALGKIYEQTN